MNAANFSLQPYAAIIFDMDGVLIDSEPLHYVVTEAILREAGHGLDLSTYTRYIGTTLRFTWTDLASRLGLPRPVEHYESEYIQRLLKTLEQPIPPQPGVADLIAAARQRHMGLAVASSASRSMVNATLRALDLAAQFSIVIAGDEVTRGKPDPEVFLVAANRLNLPPARCLVIEDAPHGVQAARAAGMDVIVVRTEYSHGHPFADATLVVDSLTDLALARRPNPHLAGGGVGSA